MSDTDTQLQELQPHLGQPLQNEYLTNVDLLVNNNNRLPIASSNEVEQAELNTSNDSFVKRLLRRCKVIKETPPTISLLDQRSDRQLQDVMTSPVEETVVQIGASNCPTGLLSNSSGTYDIDTPHGCNAELIELGALHNVSGNQDAGQDPPQEDDTATETKPTPEDTNGTKPAADQPVKKPQKTRAQIFRAKELAARRRAEKLWTSDTEGYKFKEALTHYTNIDKHIKPKDMKFIVDHREKQLCDEFGKVMRTVIRGAVHPLMDNVVSSFCISMGMSEAQKVPTVEERMFLFFSRERALKMLNRMSPKKQVYFLNFITWDHVLTDLQCLNSRLRHCSLCDGQTYPEHYCHDPEKIAEVFKSKYNAKEGTPMPKMLFVDKQTLCSHTYNTQEFNKACEEKDCPYFGQRMCRCFQNAIFIPETLVLATKTQFERVIKNFLEDKYFSQRWLIRASNLKSGDGIQFIDSAAELETFLRYDVRRKLRGQFFIMQRYIRNPMLMELRRFDCRMFLLVCVLTDRRVLGFLHPGYMREAQKEYDPASNDLRCHLTLPFTWEPDYNRYNVKKPEELPDYCHPYEKACAGLDLPQLDFRTIDEELRKGNHFICKLNCIVHEIVRSMESIIFDKPGTWQLFGLDITVDNDKNPWLYEVMTYPCQGEPDFFSATQNAVIPAVLTEALTLTFELNQRDFVTRSRLEWMDLPDIPWNKPGLITAQQSFCWLYSTSPDRLLSYKEEYKIPRLHWYHQWRITEDFNDYILYLKNFRIDSIVRIPDNNVYGRKTFDNSPVFKLKQQLKKSGVKPHKAE